MAEFVPVIEHRDEDGARRMTAHVVDDAGAPLCGTDVAVLHADSAEDARVPLSVHGVCLLTLRAQGGELAGDGRAATTVRGMLGQLDELRSIVEGAEAAPEPGPFDRRRVRAVVEFDVSLDEVDRTSPTWRGWDIATEIDLRLQATVAAMPGVVGEARTTDFRMTDPPREG